MRWQLQTLCYCLCSLSLIGGLVDIGLQIFEASERLHWRLPIILIGVGGGLPIILLPFHVPYEADDLNYDDNDISSVYQNDRGFLSSKAPESNGGSESDGSFGEGDGGAD